MVYLVCHFHLRCASLSLFAYALTFTFSDTHSYLSTEVHLWYVIPDEVKSLSLLNDYLELLPPSERKNVQGYGNHQLRKRALLARVLVRTTIARYQINNDFDPKSLRFKKNNYGKPEVDWPHSNEWSPPALQFNLSHSSSMIACAIAMNSSIGIDVEGKRRIMKNDVLSFAQRFFCQHEVDYLTAISDCQTRLQEFIKLWTLKEAYVKALGKGFSACPFKSFSITFKDLKKSKFPPEKADSRTSDIVVEATDGLNSLTNNWQFALLELSGNHYAAICMEKCSTLEGKERSLMYLKGWKTIPLVEDECVSGTDTMVAIGGIFQQSSDKV